MRPMELLRPTTRAWQPAQSVTSWAWSPGRHGEHLNNVGTCKRGKPRRRAGRAGRAGRTSGAGCSRSTGSTCGTSSSVCPRRSGSSWWACGSRRAGRAASSSWASWAASSRRTRRPGRSGVTGRAGRPLRRPRRSGRSNGRIGASRAVPAASAERPVSVHLAALRRSKREGEGCVESRCGAVAVGRTYL